MTMKETMERVLAWGAEPCVSVYVPNEQGTQAANLGTVLQNLARDAERTLHDRWPMSLSDATNMVAPLRAIAARGVQVGQLPSVGLFCRAGESTSCGLPRSASSGDRTCYHSWQRARPISATSC
jgi:hypothetical protein